MSAQFRLEIEMLRRAPIEPGVRAFSIVRNESYLLPFFLAHHRALGVRSFVFYDDNSTDGTRELLLSQPDCTVIASKHSFAEVLPNGAIFHQYLKSTMPEQFGPGHWCLTLDADEFLILPTRFENVGALADYLDRREIRLVHAPMIGFYPQRLAERNCPVSLNPFEACPWFDRSPSFIRLPHERIPRHVAGGIRYRLHRLLEAQQPEIMAQIFGGADYGLGCPWKTPLIKTGLGITRPNSHGASERPPFGIELGLAHFKFGPDLDGRIAEALELGQHHSNSIEYRFLAAVLETLGDVDLVCDDSLLYQGPATVEGAGLIWAD